MLKNKSVHTKYFRLSSSLELLKLCFCLMYLRLCFNESMDLFPILVAKQKWEVSQNVWLCSFSQFRKTGSPLLPFNYRQAHIDWKAAPSAGGRDSHDATDQPHCTEVSMFYFDWCNPVVRGLSRSCLYTHTRSENTVQMHYGTPIKRNPSKLFSKRTEAGIFY